MTDEFKRSSIDWASEDDGISSQDGVDLEALKMIEDLLKQQEQGYATTKTIIADAYFNPGNIQGFEQCEDFLLDDERSAINVISADTAQVAVLHKLLDLAREGAHVLTATAFGPKSILNGQKPNLSQLRDLFKSSKKFIAVGDLKLDFHYSPSTKNQQIELFKDQVRIAHEFNKPIYVSSVKADKELYQVMNELRDEGVRPPVICVPVARTLEMFQMILDHGCYVLIRPEITHEQEDLYRECLRDVPAERLLLASGEETSAPRSKFGKWNSPAYIDETIDYAADYLKMSRNELLRLTTINFNNLFNSNPVAGDDEFHFQPSDEEPMLFMTEAQLLENDIDEDGDELFIKEIFDELLVGDVYFDKETRILVYTPKDGFLGADKFKYVISDGRGGKDTATVTIYVSAKKTS